MLGRPAGRAYPAKQAAGARRAGRRSRSTDLSRAGRPRRLAAVRAGEIVGLAGLIGAGRSELARAIYGAAPSAAGAVTAGGSRARRAASGVASQAGVAMIPESRKDDGLSCGDRSART